MRITCVTYALTAGGAERVLSNLACGLCVRGHDVTFVTLCRARADFFHLPSAVRRIQLEIDYSSDSLWQALKGNIKRQKTLRRVLLDTRPDIVIVFLTITNVRVLLALVGTGIPVIVSERNDASARSYGVHWDFLRRALYPLAARVVSPSLGVDAYFSWLPPQKRAVIHNSVDGKKATAALPDRQPAHGQRRIIALGRLTEQKGHDLLLQAFSSVATNFPSWELCIIGEGECRPRLEKLISEFGLNGRVKLPGEVMDPFAALKNGDLYVMSSRYEGFPNALLEAMACGLPVISFNCPSGPAEIIHDGIDGILVPREDVPALAQSMARLMEDAAERMRLGANARNVYERFSNEKMMEDWEKLLASVDAAVRPRS